MDSKAGHIAEPMMPDAKPPESKVDPADVVSDILASSQGGLRVVSNNLDEIIEIWGGKNSPSPPEAFTRLQKHLKMARNALNYFIDQFEE